MIIAPGTNISAASVKSIHELVPLSGTSMASPVVAGVVASFVSYEGIDNDVEKVWNRIHLNSVDDIITGFPTGKGNETLNAFINNGISNSARDAIDPYDRAVDANATNSDLVTAFSGPTATVTGKDHYMQVVKATKLTFSSDQPRFRNDRSTRKSHGVESWL
jgi:subtilisin family serine protease